MDSDAELGSFARRGQQPGPTGFALPVALIALLVIAALIAGVFNAATEETRIGAAAADRQQALVSAESAIEVAIQGLSAGAGDSIALGATAERGIEGLAVPVTVYVTRLDSSLFWLVADAGAIPLNSGVARRIGVIVRATKGSGESIRIDRIPDRGWSELF